MHTNTILISVHTNTESYTYTHQIRVPRRNGKTPIWDAVWYSAVDIKAIPRKAGQPYSVAKFGPSTPMLSVIPKLT